jgi:hypothetical protein
MENERTLHEIWLRNIREQLKSGISVDIIRDRDRVSEIVDSYLPLREGETLLAWKEMPREYVGLGAIEFAYIGDNIFEMKDADLNVYYIDLYYKALKEVEEELNETEKE